MCLQCCVCARSYCLLTTAGVTRACVRVQVDTADIANGNISFFNQLDSTREQVRLCVCLCKSAFTRVWGLTRVLGLLL